MMSDYDSEDLLIQQEVEAEDDGLDGQLSVPVCVTDVVVTNEVIAQHLSMTTFVLNAGEPHRQILELDQMRMSATISAIDEDVVLCHSFQQVMDPANRTANLPNPNGFILEENKEISLSTTAPMWVVAPLESEATARISVVVTRRTP